MFRHTLIAAALATTAWAAQAQSATYAVDPTHTFVTIATGSISTGTAAFDQHLRGKDFFDSAESPTAHFGADNFRFDGDKVAEVRGSLTLLGKMQPVLLKATNSGCTLHPMLKVGVCGGDFETTIQRSQWGISRGLSLGFSDNVRLVVQVEALKQP